jgi:hypothetical protein
MGWNGKGITILYMNTLFLHRWSNENLGFLELLPPFELN